MNELRARLEKLQADAEDCAHIRDLATDPKKRELFARLAHHLTVLAQEMECAIGNAKIDKRD